MSIKQKLFTLAWLCACASHDVEGAPRRASSATSSTTFDQKQTGEYNIQLHLKDFQIIAVVGDDSFGDLGDYDYSYDYSDFTVKPHTSSSTTTTTKKPEVSQNGASIGSVSINAKPTSKPDTAAHPYPIVSPSTTQPPSTTQALPTVNGVTPSTNNVDKIEVSTSAPSTTTARPSVTPTSLKQASTSTLRTTSISTASTTLATPLPSTTTVKATRAEATSGGTAIPGQIPVVVQDFAIIRDETPLVSVNRKGVDAKKSDAAQSVTIVPLDDVTVADEAPALGEIMHYRRCAQGFQRDKRGRCRRVRRPQIPLGLTRFASNFASHFRQAENDNPSATTIDTL